MSSSGEAASFGAEPYTNTFATLPLSPQVFDEFVNVILVEQLLGDAASNRDIAITPAQSWVDCLDNGGLAGAVVPDKDGGGIVEVKLKRFANPLESGYAHP